VPLHKIPDDRGEFPNLQIEAIGRRGIDAERVLVQPGPRFRIVGIEIAVRAPLSEKVNVSPDLRVEEKGEASINPGGGRSIR
jgi:hypothetical protein